MTTTTSIEWATKTWGPVLGCMPVSKGCDSCYAIPIVRTRSFHPNPKVADAFAGLVDRNADGALAWTGQINVLPQRLDDPRRWRKPQRVFVNSMSDLFHPKVPVDFIAKVFATMARTPRHTYQVLTKRPALMAQVLNRPEFVELVRQEVGDPDMAWPLPNLWLGVSVEDQETADHRIPHLLRAPAAIRWISAEPLLGPVDLTPWLPCTTCKTPSCAHQPLRDATLDWVVVGGETNAPSPAKARPMHIAWARGIRDACVAAGVAFFFKQWGEWGPALWRVPVPMPAWHPDLGWLGTAEELVEAKAASEAVAATHAYAVWADQYGHEAYKAPHKPWSVERTKLPDTHAGIRLWLKKPAGRLLDGREWNEYPTARTLQKVTTHG